MGALREGLQGQKTPIEKHLELIPRDYTDPDVFEGGQQGDKYKNFIIFADMPDPDVIRVGNDYFMASSTFHNCPGVSILHSLDLVNWEIIGHAIKDVSKFTQKFSFNSMDIYGNGVWAPSLRYHEGKFYVHVGGPDLGLLVCVTDDIYSENWDVRKMKFPTPDGNWIGEALFDCCPFWDDDGKAYFTAAEPYWSGETCDYRIHLFSMDPKGRELLDMGVVIHNGRISEATKLHKFNGYYYMLFREHPSDDVGFGSQFALRSKSPYGPFEIRKLYHPHHISEGLERIQGGLIDDTNGNWWFLCHGSNYNTSHSYIGRPLMLLPVKWEDGWPIIGVDIDDDGVGEFTWEYSMPVMCENPCSYKISDDFKGEKLGHQWQWNHAPRNDMWCLTGEGLRLKAAKPIKDGGLYNACNTLTQRLFGEKGTYEVTVSLKGLKDGQYAGMVIFQELSQLLGVYQENGKKYIRRHWMKQKQNCGCCHDDYFIEDTKEFFGDEIVICFEYGDGYGRLGYYSDNEIVFVEDKFKLTFIHYRGSRVGVFSWNDFKEDGYADFCDFKHKKV